MTTFISKESFVNGGGEPPPVVGPSTGAVAGIPGYWTPPGSDPPFDPTALMNANPPVVASPATPWTSGQHVQTRLGGAAGRATWTGSAWVGGAAPLAAKGAKKVAPTGATAGTPGTFEPSGATAPDSFTTLVAGGLTANPSTRWALGEHVVLGDQSHVYWNGTVWRVGDSAPPASGVTAGSPGSFKPAGAEAPTSLATLSAAGRLGQTDPWPDGQYVVLGDNTAARWNGSSWAAS